MADATLIIETGLKGGAMITAEIANSYNKDVFAVPGRIDAPYSKGCNYLIRTNKAALVDSAQEIAEILNWETKTIQSQNQPELFMELSMDETKIMDLFEDEDLVQIEKMYALLNMSSSQIAGVLLELEFKGFLKSLPGKSYKKV